MTSQFLWRVRLYALEAKYECLKQMRMRAYLVFGLAFPMTFYALFGVIFGRGSSNGGEAFGTYYLATYGAFSVISSALFGFGAGVATERGQGWMELKQASPMPLAAYFLAKLAASMLSAATIVVLLTICGVTLASVHVPFGVWARLATTLVAGAVPFCALGLAIGYWAGPNSAIGAINLLNMPMAIVSGLWIPFDLLPALFRRIAPWLPSYHYGQLALETIGRSRGGSPLGHVLVLLAFSGIWLVLAYVGYRRDDGKTYG